MTPARDLASCESAGLEDDASHMVKTLLHLGHEPVVLDDMSTGHRDAVPPGVPFVLGDVASTADVAALVRDQRIEVVLHFAA